MNQYPEKLLAPVLSFFALTYHEIPQEFASSLKTDVLKYCSLYEHAEAAISFLVKCGEDIPEPKYMFSIYKSHVPTIALAIALTKIYPELNNSEINLNYKINKVIEW